jgi:hypothetical protein
MHLYIYTCLLIRVPPLFSPRLSSTLKAALAANVLCPNVCVVLVLGSVRVGAFEALEFTAEHDGPLELILSGFGKAPSTASYTTCNAFVVERRRLRGTSPVHSAMLGVQLAEGALRDVNLCSGALDLVDETCALALSHRKFKLLALGVHGGGFMTVGLRVVGLS